MGHGGREAREIFPCRPLPSGDRNDGPRVSSRGHHQVYQKPSHPAVSVHVGMDIDEHEMPEHHAHGGMLLFCQLLEEGRHRIPYRIGVQGHVHRLADINLSVAVSRQIARVNQASRDARREHLSVPRPVILFHHLAGVFGPENPADALLHLLVGLPGAARRHGVALIPVLFLCFRIPRAAAHALNQIARDTVAGSARNTFPRRCVVVAMEICMSSRSCLRASF
jgi:hypothetical protein